MQSQRNNNKRPAEAGRMPRCRGWCFTINNYVEEHATYLRDRVFGRDGFGIDYLVIGREKGKKGTPHLQGYVHFDGGREFGRVVRILQGEWKTPHLEAGRGSAPQNRDYCKKDGEILTEQGICPRTAGGPIAKTKDNPDGLNASIRAYQADLMAGMDQKGLWTTHAPVMIRYVSGCAKMAEFYQEQIQREKPMVFVLWGPSGCGKSHWIEQSFGRDQSRTYWARCG